MRPLLPAPAARLVAYAAFAVLGSLQWQRLTETGSAGRAAGWVLAGVATALLVARAGTAPRRLALALAGSAGLALATSGIALRQLLPGAWDELGPGLAGGAQALSTVQLPYAGADPWVVAVVELSGGGLCWLGAVLTAWPRGGAWARALALVALLVLAISPGISVGTVHGAWLGGALTVLVIGFLWLDRVARRGVAGLAALAAVVLAAAVPLGGAADREAPWFDYQAFSERFGAGAPIDFDWTQRYGSIDWPREGAEMLRARTSRGRPLYLKTEELNRFDGERWSAGSGLGEDPHDLPRFGREHPEWDVRVAVTVRRLRTTAVPSPGTTLGVESATEAVEPDVVPGPWVVPDGRRMTAGDTYVVNAHVPDPTPAELREASVDRDLPGSEALEADLLLPLPRRLEDALPPVVRARRTGGRLADTVVRFPGFSRRGGPAALVRAFGETTHAGPLLRRSGLRRSWALAQRLKAASPTPYDYVLELSRALKDPAFRYTEDPPAIAEDAEPLEAFLFETKAGFCQHYAGAMAMLLRMGGVPARVVTGFSPGGQRASSGEWIVRDTDGHAWVEAWFDGIGWVTLDPTPPASPARNLAALATPTPTPSATSAGADAAAPAEPLARRPEGSRIETAQPAAEAEATDGGSPWPVVGLGAAAVALLVAAAAWVRRRRRRPPATADRRLAELERALRRSGRTLAPGQTLQALERRLGAGGEAAAYLRALRDARYRGTPAPPPSAVQRAAFRRELAAGLGPAGRARAWLALPPRPAVRVRWRSRPR